MSRMADRIVDAVIVSLLDHTVFNDWWTGLDNDTRTEIHEDLIDLVESRIDG